MSLLKQVDALTPQALEKRNLVDLFMLRELVSEKVIDEAHFTNSRYQVADCLTKSGREQDVITLLESGALAVKSCTVAAKKDAKEGFLLTSFELAKLKEERVNVKK